MDSPLIFTIDDTRVIQNDVRALLAAMPADFRENIMHSFLWSQDKLDAYLNREMELEGDSLKDAYSHLESLIARIETYASYKADHAFPTYEAWVENEYQRYRESLTEDKEDIERLVSEGGNVAPPNTSPVDTMEDDTLAHYNHLKTEFTKKQKLADEAIALMNDDAYKTLKLHVLEMCKFIMASMHK